MEFGDTYWSAHVICNGKTKPSSRKRERERERERETGAGSRVLTRANQIVPDSLASRAIELWCFEKS